MARALGVADPQTVLADPAIKQRLRDNTEWARERGVFGVPTLVVDDEFFWGHDAVDMALDYLKSPQSFADPAMQAADTLPVGVTRNR